MNAAAVPALAAVGPGWPGVILLVLLGAWLAADETAFAQTWFAQPLPAAILAGLLVGDVALGLVVGLPFQLATLGNLPVGQSFIGDKTTPVIGVVWALAATGFLSGEGHHLRGSGGEAARMGWLLVFLALAAGFGHAVLRQERRLHLRLGAAGLRCLRDGRLDRLDSLQLRCLLTTIARGAFFTAFWAGVVVVVWIPAYAHLPPRFVRSLSFLPAFTPVLAIGALVDLYGSRRGLRWLGGSLGATLLVIAAVYGKRWIS